jgi:tungstate transport system permease protein
MAGVLLGFGRAIAEVGTVMIVGGNIRGATRVLTTAIALNTSMANYSLSIALGIILLGVALGVNIALSLVQRR